eukprot:400944-Rhodomonas_salina.1
MKLQPMPVPGQLPNYLSPQVRSDVSIESLELERATAGAMAQQQGTLPQPGPGPVDSKPPPGQGRAGWQAESKSAREGPETVLVSLSLTMTWREARALPD